MPSPRLFPVNGSSGCLSSGCRNPAHPFTGALVHQTSECLPETGALVHRLPLDWSPEHRPAVHLCSGSPDLRVSSLRVVGAESVVASVPTPEAHRNPVHRRHESQFPKIVVLQVTQSPSSPDVGIPTRKRGQFSPQFTLTFDLFGGNRTGCTVPPDTGDRKLVHRFHQFTRKQISPCPRTTVTST